MTSKRKTWLSSSQLASLEVQEKRYLAGANDALRVAMLNYVIWDDALPAWIKEALLQGATEANSELKSWDEILGVKPLGGKHEKAEIKRRTLWKKIYMRAFELTSKKRDEPNERYKKDDELFKQLSCEFKVSSAEAKRAYDKYNRLMRSH